MTADAEVEAWKAYAEASCMHDAERGRIICQDWACRIPMQEDAVHPAPDVIQ